MKSLPILLAATLVVASHAAFAQSPPQAMVVAEKVQDGGAIAGEVQVQGKIKAIDKKAHAVVIVGPNGNETSLSFGDQVKNFKQIKVGDLVTLTVQRALALELRTVNNDGIRERIESENTTTAKPGEKPGITAEKTVVVVANVTAVNEKDQTVTLRGPKQTVDLAVKDAALLKKVKVGDQVEAVYLEAVALKVSADPAAKAKPAK